MLNNKQKRGKLIVIDGTDGSGKGTQTELLIKRLKEEGYDVEKADFPQYGEPSAYMIEQYLNGKFGKALDVGPYRASIFYAIDRYHASFQMKEQLKSGKIIICNRYVSSNIGHQGGKIQDKKERKEFIAWVLDLEYNIFQIPKPNLNIFLHVPSEIAQKLVDKKEKRDYIKDSSKKRDIHEDDLSHLKDAEFSYKEAAKSDPSWTTIDCTKDGNLMTIDQVSELVWHAVRKKLK